MIKPIFRNDHNFLILTAHLQDLIIAHIVVLISSKQNLSTDEQRQIYTCQSTPNTFVGFYHETKWKQHHSSSLLVYSYPTFINKIQIYS